MKKIDFLAVVMAVVLTACGGHSKKMTLAEAEKALDEKVELIYQDTTLTGDELDAKAFELYYESYKQHKSDSLGVSNFKMMLLLGNDLAMLERLYAEGDTLLHTSSSARKLMAALANQKNMSAGCPFKELVGVDALSGDSLAISSFIGVSGKPVLVDFWSSWCGPCRQSIKDHLIDIYKEGKIDIVGVAVWEDSIDDTRKAMESLGITWPVIFSGGRENTMTTEFGVEAIPTLFLVSPDGIIISRGHNVENLIEAL